MWATFSPRPSPTNLNSRRQPGAPRWAVYAESGGKGGSMRQEVTDPLILVLTLSHATTCRSEAEKGIVLEAIPQTEF